MKAVVGVIRSMWIYHRPRHVRDMARFYAAFVKPGSLVFDIGAHAGDRTRAFIRLGCRVVAVEPQPLLARVLRVVYGKNPKVRVLQAAVSDAEGALTLRLNTRNPTVSTASADFIQAARSGAPGWEGQNWDRQITVDATTLDNLIAWHGQPSFVKIDVEGFEDRVLAGLSVPLPALSFEFTTLQREIAFRALERLVSLGTYRFNACLGESWRWQFAEIQSCDTVRRWLADLPAEANSGDIYGFQV